MNPINHAIFIDEIERYNWRNRQADSRGRLIASSPFGQRLDATPSFSVITDPASEAFGCWTDSGAHDPAWQRGGPIRLYAFLRNITEGEAREILHEEADANAPPELRVKLRPPSTRAIRQPIDIAPYLAQEVSYLTGRGITPIIQRLYRCGTDNPKNAVVMPWADPAGAVLNAKWRSTWGKAFWYAKGGAPVRSMIYGIDIAYKRGVKRATVAEAEVDAMSSSVAGTFGLAVGGSEFTDVKAELLRKSTVTELLLAADSDAAGEKLRAEIERKMRGYVRLSALRLPKYAKDLNDVLQREGAEGLREVIAAATPINSFKIFLR